MAFDGIKKFITYWWLQFELLTATYMLEPWEKRLFNTIVVALVAMSTYTTAIFLPRYTRSVMGYFGYLEG